MLDLVLGSDPQGLTPLSHTVTPGFMPGSMLQQVRRVLVTCEPLYCGRSARGTMDPGDERRDDVLEWTQTGQGLTLLRPTDHSGRSTQLALDGLQR